MIEPKILWKGVISGLDLSVNLIEPERSNRVIDKIVESKLKDNWIQKMSEAALKGATLYDGTSFRLEKLLWNSNKLTLSVSPIKFNVRSTLKKMPELERLGESYYSKGLSVGGFVQTSDEEYLFAIKSNKSLSTLQKDIIGGVLEEIEPFNGSGILNMNKIELEEEINVKSSMINDMSIIGLVQSSTTDIVIVTSTRLKITTHQLKEIFKDRIDPELDEIDYIAPNNLTSYLNELGGYKPIMGQLL